MPTFAYRDASFPTSGGGYSTNADEGFLFEVETLGDCSLFLGIQRNCIYFIDDDAKIGKDAICTNDWGVFNMEQKIVAPFPHIYSSVFTHQTSRMQLASTPMAAHSSPMQQSSRWT
ncbi:hypothetical protein ACLOJK_012714 [Asimina triloba]